MRVWQDEFKPRKDKSLIKVTYGDRLKDEHEAHSLGYRERLQHVERIRKGGEAFLIMCQAEDVTAVPRKVKDFEHENVFRGGRILEIEGECWIELGARVPVYEIAKPTIGPSA